MTEQIIIFFEIVFIDLVLAGDNAIIIGMVASQFQADQRKKIIFWGIGAAVVLRIIFTLITAYLLQINGLRLIGGILLLYIVYKLYIDVIKNSSEKKKNIKVDKSSLSKAITTVIIADVTMSLDNVLGVAGAAKKNYVLLIFGLALSIVLMATAANLITNDIDLRDKKFLTGERSNEGFYYVKNGLDQTIDRGLSYAPYAGILWCETAKPNLDEARKFAAAIHAEFPGKLLCYN